MRRSRTTPTVDLLLTGTRHSGRFLIRLSGEPIWLSTSLWRLVCKLILARQDGTGFTPAPAHTVSRLRSTIDRALNRSRAGESLIETGAGREYRLAMALERVGYSESLLELVTLGVIGQDQLREITRVCKKASSRTPPANEKST